MSKFHINKHGVPALCKAKPGNCPLGGDETHFGSREEAQEAINKINEEKHGLLSEMREKTKENMEEKTKMTEYKKYYAGENHYQWEVKLVIYQKRNLYKFVLTDDEDNIYAVSNYVTPETAVALEETIDEIMQESALAQYESLTDIYNRLKDTFYGQLFYLGSKIAPQLTDGILLLSLAE